MNPRLMQLQEEFQDRMRPMTRLSQSFFQSADTVYTTPASSAYMHVDMAP